MKKSAVAIFLLGFHVTSAFAESSDGALPRGNSDASNKKLIQPLSKGETIECLSYHAAPFTSDLLLSGENGKAYFVSREKSETSASSKAFLYEVDVTTNKYKRIVSLRANEASALVGHGEPFAAISVFDFKQGCGEGVSAGIGLKWVGEQKIIKSFPSARYKIVPSDQGVQVADLDQRTIKSLDVQSFQKRSVGNFPSQVIPLFIKLNPPILYGFSPELAELQRFEEHESMPKAVLKLKKGMRLVQQNELFAVINPGDDPRVLQLKLVKGWSGDLFKNYEFQLPEKWSFEESGTLLDFATGTIMVFPAKNQDKREKRQVITYSLSKPEVEKVITADKGQYFSQIGILPRSSKLLILSRGLSDDVVQSIKIGDLEKGEWRDIIIN